MRLIPSFKILMACLLVFGSLACTRKTEDSSRITLSLPSTMQSIQAVSGTLAHILVNVSGPYMGTVVYNWDEKGAFGIINTPPSNIVLEVPSGPDRLIQVICVYKDSTTSAMSFYYGEDKKTLDASDVPADIVVTKMGGSTGQEGQIQGQYLTSASSGPTGLLQIKIRPNTSSPPMLIQETAMVNGWFSVFSLSGQKFEYVLNGSPLFSGAMDLNDFRALASNAVLITKVPDYFRATGSGSTNAVLEKSRDDIRGYFGPGVGSQVVYYATGSSPMSGYYASAGLNTPINYTGGSTAVSTDIYFVGGVGGTGSGTNYTNFIQINPTNVNRRLQVPLVPDYYFYISGSTAMFNSWSVLPGLSGLISNYSIYGVAFSAFDTIKLADHDGIDCDKLIQAQASYPNSVILGAASSVIGANLSFSVANMPANAKYIMCPTTSSGSSLPGVTLN